MKKILYKFLLPFAFLSSLSISALAIDEILITAERCPYYASCLTGNDMYWYMLLNYASWGNYAYSGGSQAAVDAAAKKKKEEEIAQCKANASGAGYQCRNSYRNLGNMCSGVDDFLFSGGVSTMKMFLGKLSTEAATAFGIAQAGSVILGAQYDDMVLPCGELTEKAMAFCDAGAAKIASECK
jgi:hypothetical protein